MSGGSGEPPLQQQGYTYQPQAEHGMNRRNISKDEVERVVADPDGAPFEGMDGTKVYTGREGKCPLQVRVRGRMIVDVYRVARDGR